MSSFDYENLVPSEIASEVVSAVSEESAALRLGRTVRLPAGVSKLPVVSAVPQASFVAARGGRKPITQVEWTTEQISPEEIACVTFVPDDFLADSAFPVWDSIKPLMIGAIGLTLDQAVFTGLGAPASYPAGGLVALAGAPVTGATALEALSEAMGVVEDTGLEPSGHVTHPGTGRVLRNLKDENGNLVYLPAITEGAPAQLYDKPIMKTQAWDPADGDVLTGDWDKLVIGIREDIRFDFSNEATLYDEAGEVVVSAFQDDVTIMRVFVRVGVAVGQPINYLGETTQAFAIAEFPEAEELRNRSKAKRSTASSRGSRRKTAVEADEAPAAPARRRRPAKAKS